MQNEVNQPQQQPIAAAQQMNAQPRIYRGRADKQADPNAIARPRGQQQQPKPQAQQQRGQGMKKFNLPRTLNKPGNLPTPEQQKAVTLAADDPVRNSLFAHGINVREVDADRRITPAASSLIEVSRDMYRELITDDPNIQKSVLPEYLDYYATSLLWFRITALKRLAHDELSLEEERLLRIIEGCSLCVPEPIMLQLRMFGKIQTLTGEHLRSEFPPLPVQIIQGFGGYYGPISVATHNLYEEIPCIGVVSESVRHAVSNDPPGLYASALAAEGIVPNENLLGYKPLGARRSEAKNLAFDAGITANIFPASPTSTGINLRFLLSISGVLAQTKTFKMSMLDITTMAEAGSIAQAIMQKAVSGTDLIQKNGEVYPYANFRDQDSAFGFSLVYTPNLFKEGATAAIAPEWCCINAVPPGYILNRNVRREAIPPDYRREAFRALTQSGSQYRQISVRMMVSTKR